MIEAEKERYSLSFFALLKFGDPTSLIAGVRTIC